MPYVLFHDFFPEIAERETHTVTVLKNSAWGLPPAHYSLLEMYCDEPGCDCRRVFFYVISSLTNQAEAVIAYGWESPEFYARWMGEDDPGLGKYRGRSMAGVRRHPLLVATTHSLLSLIALGAIQVDLPWLNWGWYLDDCGTDPKSFAQVAATCYRISSNFPNDQIQETDGSRVNPGV